MLDATADGGAVTAGSEYVPEPFLAIWVPVLYVCLMQFAIKLYQLGLFFTGTFYAISDGLPHLGGAALIGLMLAVAGTLLPFWAIVACQAALQRYRRTLLRREVSDLREKPVAEIALDRLGH